MGKSSNCALDRLLIYLRLQFSRNLQEDWRFLCVIYVYYTDRKQNLYRRFSNLYLYFAAFIVTFYETVEIFMAAKIFQLFIYVYDMKNRITFKKHIFKLTIWKIFLHIFYNKKVETLLIIKKFWVPFKI